MVTLPTRSPVTGSGRRRGRLPGVQDVPQVQVASDPGVAVPSGAFGGMDLSIAAEGLRDFADSIRRAEEKQQAERDFAETTQAKLKYDREVMEEFQRRQLDDDPARPGFMDDMEKFAQERKTSILGGVPEDVSETAKTRLGLTLDAQSNAIRDSAGRLSIQESQRKAQDALQAGLNSLSVQAEQYPDSYQDIIAQADDAIADLSPSMTADQKRDAKVTARVSVVESAVQGKIKSEDFRGAVRILEDPDLEESIGGKTRDALLRQVANAEQSADKRRADLAEKAERQAKEAAKKQSDALTKQGISLSVSGELTTDWVMKRQEVLDLSDFKTLMKAAAKEDGDDNNVVIADIYRRMAAGEDIERVAIEQFADGNLSRPTMNTILSRNDSLAQRGGAKTPFQRASSYLSKALRPSELNDNPDASAAYANAEADLMTFFDEKPQATVDQAMGYARELASSYRLVPGTTLSLPFPNWMEGDRLAKQPKLDETEEKIVRDLSAGRIDADTARRRAAVIRKWRDFLEEGSN